MITKNQNLMKNRKTQPDSEFQKVEGVVCDGEFEEVFHVSCFMHSEIDSAVIRFTSKC